MKSLTHLLTHRNVSYRMLGLLMRYYLYFIDHNLDLDVDLRFYNFAQFDCAHLNYVQSMSTIKLKVNAFVYPRIDCAGTKIKLS